MSLTINEYVCNLIAGKTKINKLYSQVDRSRAVRGNSGGYLCVKVDFAGIGCKTYSGYEILQIDDDATKCTLSGLIAKYAPAGIMTVDMYVAALLFGRRAIRTLYQNEQKALFMRSTSRIYTVSFKNPFGIYADVTSDCFQMKGPEFLQFFCECEHSIFTPTSVFSFP